MTGRLVDGTQYSLGYDEENHLVTLSGGSLAARYVYDGDGKRVLAISGDTRTLFVSPSFEVSIEGTTPTFTDPPLENYPLCHYQYCFFMPLLMGGTDGEVLGMHSGNFGSTRYHTHPIEPTAANVTWRVYYPGGGLRAQTSSSYTLTYLLTDHLNSTTTTLDTDGVTTAWLRYDAWGVTRSSSGTTPTDKRYTGQYEAEAGLYFYNARWYDPKTGRFAQADTIIPEPGDPLAWDRYAYVDNNPLTYSDPSGHCSLSSSSLLTPFGFLAFYGSCVQDIKDTYNAYQAGERNLGALYMEATGIKDSVVSLATDVHQLNQDFSTVFSDAPFIERLDPSVHVGSFAVGTAATLIGIGQLVKVAIETISIKTPYGRAWQSLDTDALKLRRQVSNGMEIYRGGMMGKTNVAEGQFWAPESPLNQNFASRYGAGSYSGIPDFVIGGNIKPRTPFVIRRAPGIGSNLGGALEIVTIENGVRLNYFFMY